MAFSIVKIAAAMLVSTTCFIMWNLFCSRTILYSSTSECTTTLVYIVQYEGHHNSLLLPVGDHWKELSYGDWDVYGNSKVNFWTGFKSMGLPSQSTLGTRTIEWDGLDEQQLPAILDAQKVISLRVEGAKAQALSLLLDAYIKENRSDGIFNPLNKLFFVKHPKAYAAWYTCNNMLIDWLRSMGVQSEGWGWAGNFQVA